MRIRQRFPLSSELPTVQEYHAVVPIQCINPPTVLRRSDQVAAAEQIGNLFGG